MPTQLIPTYALYGEYLEESLEDFLHFEQLRTRSEKHNWSIKAHKHDTLWQIFYLETSGSVVEIDGRTTITEEPVFVSLPPLCVHAFRFPDNAIGGAISVQVPNMQQVLNCLPESEFLAGHWCFIKKSETSFAPIMRAYQNLVTDFSNIDHLRNQALKADLTAMLIAIMRQELPREKRRPEQTISNLDDQLRKFCRLVEEKHRLNWTTERFAREVDISPASLNRKCRQVLGSSPQSFLTKRRILEAKRLLKFTRLSVSEISDDLGFTDTSYFCRYFKKSTSQTPAAYRRQLPG